MSFPPLDVQFGPQGSRGVYIRAQRGSLPPRASDMLAVRNRAIDGIGLSPTRFAALPAATRNSPVLDLKFPGAGSAASATFCADYEGLSDRIIWNVVMDELPRLKAAIQAIATQTNN
jgi:hypothetical protein